MANIANETFKIQGVASESARTGYTARLHAGGLLGVIDHKKCGNSSTKIEALI